MQQEKRAAQKSARRQRIEQRDAIGLHDAPTVAGPVILGNEAGAGCIKGGHDIIGQRIGIGGSGVTLYHHRLEIIHSRLNEQIGHSEHHILQRGGNADAQHPAYRRGVQANILQAERIGPLTAAETAQHQHGRQVLGNDAGQRNARHGQLKNNDKQQVQSHIDNACNTEINQRVSPMALRMPLPKL